MFMPKTVLIVFLISLFWWGYLGYSTRMEISADAVDYEQSGRLLQEHGLVPAYFDGGPRREPLYPLLVAASMQVEKATGIEYTRVMAAFGIVILLVSQILLFAILRQLDVHPGICAAVLLYFAFSPAITNSAFSLYSEILTYPLVLTIIKIGTVPVSFKKTGTVPIFRPCLLGAGFGAIFLLATFVKGIFECVFPVYLAIMLIAIYARRKPDVKPLLIFTLSALAIFYTPLLAYKNLNFKHNGTYALTSRWPWMLYGNAAQRTQPLSPRQVMAAVAYVPGEGVCKSIFSEPECSFWSFAHADGFGFDKKTQLGQDHVTDQRINEQLSRLALQAMTQHPFQYSFLSGLECLKPLFWESTQIGFVVYPSWLKKIYDIKILNNGLRLVMALLSFIGVVILLTSLRRSALLFSTGLMILLFTVFLSFITILSRYAFPIVPLYLICIAWAANCLYTNRHATVKRPV